MTSAKSLYLVAYNLTQFLLWYKLTDSLRGAHSQGCDLLYRRAERPEARLGRDGELPADIQRVLNTPQYA